MNIITRKGHKLYDGEKEFRFISINIPNLHINEDPLPHWHRVDSWEIENAFKTINLIGGQVTRTYTLSIKGGIRPGEHGRAHIYGPGEFDEELLKDLDKVLELANKYQIRLIIPFIDQWDWFGGISHFAAFRDKMPLEFWTDSQIIGDFKEVLRCVINRVNTITKIPYKEDPAIMAWETGNELECPDSWSEEITSYIKSLDPNHLVMDGKYGISLASLENENIDIVTNHYYVDRGKDIIGRLNKDIFLTYGKKPFIIGEFNHVSPNLIKELLENSVSRQVAGTLLWSLRYHNKNGGFYYHGEMDDPYNPCYNWPGFSSRVSNGELEKMNYLRVYAYKIRNLSVPPIEIPEPPLILPIKTPHSISWRGSAGAETYILERATSKSGPWVTISSSIIENMVPFVPFCDYPAMEGNYYYRMFACNKSGVSSPSNAVLTYYRKTATKQRI
ncbi:glycoside hydrolase 5 family protein [Priestia aryabhattai]